MKTITKVSVQAKNKNRSNIYLDGSYYCSLDNLLVIKHNLKPDMDVEEDFLSKIQEESEYNLAFDQALNYITHYKKTQKQIIDYLMKKGYVYPLCFKVVEKLKGYGLADDGDYARSYIEENCKNKGKLLIKMQLRAKGVDEKTSETALDMIEDETPACINVGKKYMKSKEKTRENFGKCYRYLLSKGFSYDAVSSAINTLKGDEDDY